MFQSCSINKCTRTSRGLCDCCQQKLCLQHLNEHNATLLAQLNPLTDQANTLGHRLKTLNIHTAIANSRQKLEQWRQDCYRKIDCLFEQKCQELDQLVNETVNQKQEELNRIHSKITELIYAQETTGQDIDLLKSAIRQLETNMNSIEQTYFTINTCPLILDDTFISITKTIEKGLDLSTLSLAYKTIVCPEGSFGSLTGNDRYILIHQHPNLCLFDREINITKQTLWFYGAIHDMCWSSTLDRFIILGKQNIYLIDESTMSIEDVHTIAERNWKSCACSDTVLFVCTNEWASSIMEFTLFSEIKLIHEWKYPVTCNENEIIHDMTYNNRNLALIIKNKSQKSLRIELRYVKTFDRIWTLQIDTACVRTIPFRCCSLVCNEWLFADYETGHLLQITKDGKLKKTIPYHPNPWCVILFDRNKLVVSTMDDVRLHTIQQND
ncbi:unnamed protein product [Rotaria sp. Silwood1]|nr:unnamed protein product [Rotaria sp. Silwood1]